MSELCFCFCVALNSSSEKLKSQSLCSFCQGGTWFTPVWVQPVPLEFAGLPRLDRQPMTWEGEMLKETASPEVSLKPLSLGQSGGVGFFLGDAGKLKQKATMEKVPQRGTVLLHSQC